MASLQRDPVTNVIYRGIRRDVDTLIEAEGFRGAVILIYAGIDAMAYLHLPAGREVSAV